MINKRKVKIKTQLVLTPSMKWRAVICLYIPVEVDEYRESVLVCDFETKREANDYMRKGKQWFMRGIFDRPTTVLNQK